MRLGQQLLSEGLVSEDQLEEGLRHQVLHGGRLGSNLVELRHIGLDDLARALGRQHVKPAALETHFDQIDRELAAMLSPDLAARWHAVPLGRTAQDANHVAVATSDPLDDEALYELEAVFESEVVIAISPELRLLYWLERIYGIERINRFKRVSRTDADEFEPEPTDPDRRGYVKTLSDVEFVEAPSHRQLARIAVQRIAMPVTGETDVPNDFTDLDGTLRAIRQANSRNRVARLVTSLIREGFDNCFSAGTLLIIREGLAMGWEGFVRDMDDVEFDALAVPLQENSMLSAPYTHREPFLGEYPTPTVIDERFWLFMGSTPKEIAVVPIEVMDEVACLLYVQSPEPMPAEHAGALGDLSRSIAAAFSKLIKASLR